MNIIAPINLTAEASWGTRASSATYWDRAGVLQSAAANALRITYDPRDLKAAPYPLLEPAAATNQVRNSTMQGAAVGAPGTDPNLWQLTAVTGVSRELVAKGTEAGIAYVDYRFLGNATGEIPIYFEGLATVAALGNQAWVASAFLKLAGGSRSGVPGVALRLYEGTAAGAKIAETNAPAAITGGGLSAQRYSVTKAATDPSTERVSAALVLTVAGAFDITVRIGLPQLERDRVSSPILTTAAAVTRAADVVGTAPGLLYSNLVENDTDDAPLWVSGQAVAKDQYRRRAETHKVYRALQAIPTSLTATPESDPKDGTGNPYWLEWEPTNRWAAFDTTLDTPSIGGELLQWVVRPGQLATALAALAMDATEIRIGGVTHTGALVYRKTRNLVLKTSRKWTDFLFKQIERRSDEAFLDLPPFKTAMYCITVTKTNSTAKIGDVKIGRLEELGELQIEPEVRTLRRSSIKDDGYGRYKFNKRPSSKLLNCNVWIDGRRVDTVTELINKYTAEPCVMVGDERFSSLIILGFVQDFRVTLNTAESALYNLQAQGLG